MDHDPDKDMVTPLQDWNDRMDNIPEVQTAGVENSIASPGAPFRQERQTISPEAQGIARFRSDPLPFDAAQAGSTATGELPCDAAARYHLQSVVSCLTLLLLDMLTYRVVVDQGRLPGGSPQMQFLMVAFPVPSCALIVRCPSLTKVVDAAPRRFGRVLLPSQTAVACTIHANEWPK